MDDEGQPLRPIGRPVIAYDAVVTSEMRVQSSAWLRLLKQTLDSLDKDASLQDPENQKACLPNPGVAIRFTSSGRKLDLLLCFECDMLAFAHVESKTVIAWKNFDTHRRTLATLAKQALPDDKAIQSL
jgi:hypothetical protein